jgi:flagellin
MVVANNIQALNSHRNLKAVGTKQEKASARLSSGYRINSAADDAAGLAISEKMRAQIRGLTMASKNSQDAISLIQTAEGGMQEIDNMIQRIRELVVYAANDTQEHNGVGTGDRQKIQDEINQLVAEIDSMAERVEFNKKKVINGDYADARTMFQAAVTRKASATVRYAEAKGAYTRASSSATSVKSKVAGYSSAYTSKITAYSAAIATGGNVASAKFAMESAGTSYISAMEKYNSLMSQAAIYSATAKTAFVALSAASTAWSQWSTLATAQTGTAGLYIQVGPNAGQGLQIAIGKVKSDILGIGDGNGLAEIDVRKSSGSEITGLLENLDIALSYVTTERSRLGAAQNRLEYTINSLDVSAENLTSAESRVRDADMAKEMMNLTQANILQQAAVAMLAQANQSPQSILQLLQ